ncbi:cbb3-type cytochrome c oxidase N-terminal domain-containing protein [Pedobacter duraquae]|uniref:Cytochrome c oxidase cbb3-type subunit 3 n=1 Tax=Pedobacter duraquae TaxID=425511 RepID=A0A4R6IQY8_9SPHI|nr:cbb3-type cytochrome c oxidase N-terminal domain-containing protein [Pedobacter duraquae]TDO24814.1 cytochrome c oxidase cbb3-type subunit 3 [Pedobacter duraquae]
MSSADIVVIVMLVASILVLGVTILLLKVIRFYVKESIDPTVFATPEQKALLLKAELEAEALKKAKPSIWTRLMGLKPIAEEESLIMEHKFDGISELNNPTPAWFMVLFYGTIIVAVLYMCNYEFLGFGKTQEEEYIAEVEQANNDKLVFLASPANAKSAVNENNIVQSKDPAMLSAGAGLFQSRCTPCHGAHAEGIVGPNLTDEYWLHGGSVKEVFTTIKYGVPAKGMIAWEKSLSAQQIAELTNYVLSLQGSKPAGAKAPQGDKQP